MTRTLASKIENTTTKKKEGCVVSRGYLGNSWKYFAKGEIHQQTALSQPENSSQISPTSPPLPSHFELLQINHITYNPSPIRHH